MQGYSLTLSRPEGEPEPPIIPQRPILRTSVATWANYRFNAQRQLGCVPAS
jgi:hypothetical protein